MARNRNSRRNQNKVGPQQGDDTVLKDQTKTENKYQAAIARKIEAMDRIKAEIQEVVDTMEKMKMDHFKAMSLKMDAKNRLEMELQEAVGAMNRMKTEYQETQIEPVQGAQLQMVETSFQNQNTLTSAQTTQSQTAVVSSVQTTTLTHAAPALTTTTATTITTTTTTTTTTEKAPSEYPPTPSTTPSPFLKKLKNPTAPSKKEQVCKNGYLTSIRKEYGANSTPALSTLQTDEEWEKRFKNDRTFKIRSTEAYLAAPNLKDYLSFCKGQELYALKYDHDQKAFFASTSYCEPFSRGNKSGFVPRHLFELEDVFDSCDCRECETPNSPKDLDLAIHPLLKLKEKYGTDYKFQNKKLKRRVCQ